MGNAIVQSATIQLKDRGGPPWGSVAADLPLGSPSITGFTGTFGQGNTLTLNVSNSTVKNTSQVAFHTGDSLQDGITARDILAGSETTNISSYKHSTADSFMGSGASLISNMQAGGAGGTDSYINLASMEEVYFSTVNKIDVNVAGLDSEGQQLKQNRLNTGYDGSHGTPLITSTVLYNTDDVNVTSTNNDIFTYNSWVSSDSAISDYTVSGFGNWVRRQMYWKASTLDVADGSIWWLDTDQRDGTDYFGGREFWAPDWETTGIGYRDINDPDQQNVVPSPAVWIPLNKHVTKNTIDDTTDNMNRAWLPYFKRDSSQIDVAVDGIYINDSLERVELINAPTYELATKRVVQEQQVRGLSSISFKCYEANFIASDSIYAVTFNSDGQFSTGTLIRTGV